PYTTLFRSVHLDVDRQEVVAAFRAVLADLLEEQAGGDPFADQPALHVGEGDDHGVDAAVPDALAELVDGQIAGSGWYERIGHVIPSQERRPRISTSLDLEPSAETAARCRPPVVRSRLRSILNLRPKPLRGVDLRSSDLDFARS